MSLIRGNLKFEVELTRKLADILLGERIPLDVVDVGTGEILLPANQKIRIFQLRKVARAELTREGIEIDPSPIRGTLRRLFDTFASEKKITLSPLRGHPASFAGLI